MSLKVIVLGCFLVIILLPISIDKFIFSNTYPSHIDNNAWASFLGSYLGSIIGGLLSLFGIIMTIRFTRNQNNKDRELQVRPYFDFTLKDNNDAILDKKQIAYIGFGFEEDKENNAKRSPVLEEALIVHNIGVGTAIKCKLNYHISDTGRDIFPVLQAFSANRRYSSSILPGGKGVIQFCILLNFQPIMSNMVINENGFIYLKDKEETRYKNFNIDLEVSYSDILENRYKQKIVLEAFVYTKISGDKAEHCCDIILKSVSDPIGDM